MKVTRSEPHKCPYCGYKMDSQTGIDNESSPSPGDMAICFGCAGVGRYDENLIMTKMPEEDLEKLKEEAPKTYWLIFDARLHIQAIRQLHPVKHDN